MSTLDALWQHGGHRFEELRVRGVDLNVVRAGAGVPLLLLHGYPETNRIWLRVIGPLAASGFDVIAPDLRGFGLSAIGPDGLHDLVASALDMAELLDQLELSDVVVLAGDFGGAVAQDLAVRRPDLVDRLVLFNCPLPRLPELADFPPTAPGTHDYYVRQGQDPDGLATELANDEERRAYIASFYTTRGWAPPAAFDPDAVAFHVEPFADSDRLRACWGCYEAAFKLEARTGPTLMGRDRSLRTLLLHGAADAVVPRRWGEMAAIVYPNHVGPIVLPDIGHFVQWEAPEELIAATENFVGDRLSSSAK